MKNRKISVSSLPVGNQIDDQIAYAKQVELAGADAYHVDVMDGKFVPATTIDYNATLAVKQNTNLIIDVHLMCDRPKRQIEKYVRAGADMITVHVEAFRHACSLKGVLRHIHRHNLLACLAIDLDTDVKTIFPFLNCVDAVLVMSVKAGAGGQKFDPIALDKVRALRAMDKNLLISVDGGVNADNAKEIWSAGADVVAVGSFVAKAKDKRQAIIDLKR